MLNALSSPNTVIQGGYCPWGYCPTGDFLIGHIINAVCSGVFMGDGLGHPPHWVGANTW